MVLIENSQEQGSPVANIGAFLTLQKEKKKKEEERRKQQQQSHQHPRKERDLLKIFNNEK